MPASKRLVTLRQVRDDAETAIGKSPLDPQRLADFDLAKAVYEAALAEEVDVSRRVEVRQMQEKMRADRSGASARRP